MPNFDELMLDLIAANRILASEGIVDAFGHVSVRDPRNPDRFLLSRARSPELIERADIMEFTLDGTPHGEASQAASDGRSRKPYLERFIHGSLYERRADVQCVVHSHSRSVIPFGITGEKLKPVMHSCATIGEDIPVWEARDAFGDTDLLVSNVAMGRDLARAMGDGTSVLMRGHGSTVAGQSIREAVYTAVYLEVNANLQLKASRLGKIAFLSKGEIEKIKARLGQAKPGEGFDRSWEYWCRHADVPYRPRS